MDDTNLEKILTAYTERNRNDLTEFQKAGTVPTSPCIDDELIAAYTDGDCTEEENRTVLSHILKCRYCLHRVSFLVQVKPEVDKISHPAAGKTVRICRNCHLLNLHELKYCQHCGKILDDKTKLNQKVHKHQQWLKNKFDRILNDPGLNVTNKIERILHLTGATCGMIAIQPIPIADIFILTPIQTVMVLYIGKIIGFPVNLTRAKEILTEIVSVIGMGLIAQHAVIAGYKTIIPFAGGLFTIPIVWGITYGIGKTAIKYYELKRSAANLNQTEFKIQLQSAFKQGNRISKTVKRVQDERLILHRTGKQSGQQRNDEFNREKLINEVYKRITEQKEF